MKSLIWIAANGAFVIMIRKADELPFWADLTITSVGLVGIMVAVVLARRAPEDA